MIILFDLFATQPYGKIRFNGGAEYVKKIFKETLSRLGQTDELHCVWDSSFILDDDLKKIINDYRITLHDLKIQSLDTIALNIRADTVFLGIGQRYKKLSFNENIKVILVLHDVRDMEFSFLINLFIEIRDQGPLKIWLKTVIKTCFYDYFKKRHDKIVLERYFGIVEMCRRENTIIVTDSSHSRYMLSIVFPEIKLEKIKLLWVPSMTENIQKAAVDVLENEKFWLVVSAGRHDKNAFPVITAFLKNAKLKLSGVKLVLVGIETEPLKKICKGNIPDNIINFNYVDRDVLEWLYSACEAFIYPSFIEGFGIPPVEAMRFSKPLLVSATSSIMEICGNAPIYMCPYSDWEVEARLCELLDSDFQKLSELSAERYNYVEDKQNIDLENIINLILGKTC